MSWLESHQELRDHPKTARLRRRLGVSLPAAIGHLHLLWWWALDYAPTGSLAGFDPDVIADAACWQDDPGLFVRALIGAGFVDEDLQIHDWDDYAGRLIDRREANAKRMRAARWARRAALVGDVAFSAHEPDATAARAAHVRGLPDLTGPNSTGPDLPDTYNPQPLLPQAGAGERFPDDVIDRLSCLPVDLSSAAFHDAAESALTALGFACEREVWLPDRGTGRRGRLDLLARRRGITIAFELDNRSPESGSLLKLRFIEATFRVIVLRNPADRELPSPPDGIVLIGAGRSNPRRRRGGDDAQTAPSSPEVPSDLVPATDADRELWAQARSALTADWLPANREKAQAVEALGRAADGALWLRAPPSTGASGWRHVVAGALVEAGDTAGADVVIVEG